MRRSSSISAAPIETFIDGRLKPYRNLLHDAILAMPKDQLGRRLIPKPDQVEKYRLWTKVMYNFSIEDFVVAADQVKNDFRATCSLLEQSWKVMSGVYQDLMKEPVLSAALLKGTDAPTIMGTPPASGAFVLGPLSVAGQPTSGAFVVPPVRKM